ncbi:hypothetical protein D3C71_775740 [compost metagenome]
MLHVQAVQRLVQQHVARVLAQHHRHERALALSAGHLVQIAAGQRLQVQIRDGLVDMALVVQCQAAARVRIAAKGHQVLHRQPQRQVVVLPQDRQAARQFAAIGARHVQAFHQHAPRAHRQQPAHHGQQGGLARPVRSDDGCDSARRQMQADVVDHHGIAVLLADVLDFYHRRPLRRIRTRNITPPTNSITTLTVVFRPSTRSSSVCPPTRKITLNRAAAGTVCLCLSEPMA